MPGLAAQPFNPAAIRSGDFNFRINVRDFVPSRGVVAELEGRDDAPRFGVELPEAIEERIHVLD